MKKTLIGLSVLIGIIPLTAFGQRDIACSITATPTRAAPGEQVMLRWNSHNARSATLVGFGPVPLSGSRVVQATQTTDYKIMVSGYENNYVGCIARITVTAKQPTCNISLVPFTIASNSFATLSWSTDFADSVYISTLGNVPPKGNQMVRATGHTTYYLSARGAGGFCERSAQLSVRDNYASQSYGYFPSTIQSIAAPLFGYSNNRSNTNSKPSYSQSPTYSYDSDYDTYYESSGYYDEYDSWDDAYYYGEQQYEPVQNNPEPYYEPSYGEDPNQFISEPAYEYDSGPYLNVPSQEIQSDWQNLPEPSGSQPDYYQWYGDSGYL